MMREELDTRILGAIVAVLLGVLLAIWLSGCVTLMPADCREACKPRNVAVYETSIGKGRCECFEASQLEFKPEKEQRWLTKK